MTTESHRTDSDMESAWADAFDTGDALAVGPKKGAAERRAEKAATEAATTTAVADAAPEPESDPLAGRLIDPWGQIIDPEDIDAVIEAYERVQEAIDNVARPLYDFRSQCADVLRAASDQALSEAEQKTTVTRRVRGRSGRVKVELPAISWDQPLLREAFNSYPKLRDSVLKIGTITVKGREYKKLEKEAGPADFEQFKKMVMQANRGRTGTPKVTIEESPTPPPATARTINTADASADDWEAAIEHGMEIIEMCNEVPERGEDFAMSVAESVRDVIETIEITKRVTEGQLESLNNWEAGIGRWLDH